MQGLVDVLDRVPEDPVEGAFDAACYYVGRRGMPGMAFVRIITSAPTHFTRSPFRKKVG